MELKGKKIYFLGDSITEGVGASDAEHCYVSVFGKLSGAIVKNYGISATRIACQTENLTTKEPDLSFVNRVDSMDSDADVVVVFGGTNDFGHGDAKLGTFESRDPYTFYGAMHVLCEKLINRFPNADILFMTPLHRCSEDEVSKENGLPEETNLAAKLLNFTDFRFSIFSPQAVYSPRSISSRKPICPTDCIPPMQVHCGSHCGSWDFCRRCNKKDDAIALTLC